MVNVAAVVHAVNTLSNVNVVTDRPRQLGYVAVDFVDNTSPDTTKLWEIYNPCNNGKKTT
jgi:hypothetical protein